MSATINVRANVPQTMSKIGDTLNLGVNMANIVGAQYTEVEYGLLYNWYTATDVREIAATGWHVPHINEFQTLANYLGADGDYVTNTIGGKLKETGLIYWNNPNVGATNETSFNGRGAGYRDTDGSYSGMYNTLLLWTTYVPFVNTGCTAHLVHNSEALACLSAVGQTRTYGYSIRPVKDFTTLSHGETGIYTGNDGKVYRTICIGTQEWLASNLCETKYRNNDSISEVTGNNDWIALITGALCAYNNDWDNV